jgi:glycosyltransferase involved in cell wall biosynthesis
MKSLFLTFWYPNHKNPNYCAFIREHAIAIAKTNIEVKELAFTCSNGNSLYKKTVEKKFLLPNLEEHHVYIESFLYRFINFNPFHLYFIAWNYYKKELLSFLPSVIHSNIIHPGAIVGHWFSKKLGISHVITEHWSGLARYMKRNPFSKLGQNAYNKAAAITVVSQFYKGYISTYTTNEKIVVIPNVIENVLFTYKPKPKDKEKIEFLYVGYLNLPKLPFLTLDALELAQKSINKPLVLNIIGIGILEPSIREHIKGLSYQVNLLGPKKKNEVVDYMQHTDFYIHAANIETFSIVTAEALSTGTPVIASNRAALPELVNSTNGILANNTVAEFSSAIVQAIHTDFNHEEIARKMEGRFSYLRIGEAFLKVYEEVI